MAETAHLSQRTSMPCPTLEHQLQVRGISNEGVAQILAGRMPTSANDKLRQVRLVAGFAGKLGAVGDDAALADVDLQNTLRKQQQPLKMVSNIIQMQNDTARAMIRRFGD